MNAALKRRTTRTNHCETALVPPLCLSKLFPVLGNFYRVAQLENTVSPLFVGDILWHTECSIQCQTKWRNKGAARKGISARLPFTERPFLIWFSPQEISTCVCRRRLDG